MSKTLVLAEKPSVARDIARVLKCFNKQNGYIEGNKYVVTWALGHLVTLSTPEVYDDKYKNWRLEDLPIIPNHFSTEVISKTRKQFQSIKKIINRNDINEIVIATDAGREGELVARWILEKLNNKKNIKRLWISSVTDKAILTGFNNLKDGRLYNNLYYSAVARSIADWVVGINATRALTCKFNAELSCGRVQTPTLALIAKREEEVRNFKPKNYYGIKAIANGISLTWIDKKSNDVKTFNKDTCEKILSELKNKNTVVVDINKTNKKSYSPQLYDLTELQRDANRLFGFSAKETLSTMQSLYEYHKVLTYPRTDSRYLTSDVVDTLHERLIAINIPYKSYTSKLLNKPIKANSNFINNKKVSDHHAIIPTEQHVNINNLSDKERKIFDLVAKRFISVLYPPCEYEQITLKTNIGNETFIAKGKKIITNGWKEIYSNNHDEDSDNQILPSFNKGDVLKIKQILLTTNQTKPPGYFNEGTLLKVMENPVKYMETNNKELIKTIGDTKGLGTVATRADIIEKLFNKYYIEKRGNDIITTSKGRQLLNLVPEKIQSPILTAQWEQKLFAIEKGELSKDSFINEMKEYSKKTVHDIKNSNEKFKHDNISGSRCPDCDKLLLEVKRKDIKMLVCQDRNCRYKKIISKTTNARCPKCHKRLELYGQGDGQIFICKCGYKEKLTTFNERKKKEQKSISKKDVGKYIKNINKDSDVSMNTALQEALKNLKLK